MAFLLALIFLMTFSLVIIAERDSRDDHGEDSDIERPVYESFAINPFMIRGSTYLFQDIFYSCGTIYFVSGVNLLGLFISTLS